MFEIVWFLIEVVIVFESCFPLPLWSLNIWKASSFAHFTRVMQQFHSYSRNIKRTRVGPLEIMEISSYIILARKVCPKFNVIVNWCICLLYMSVQRMVVPVLNVTCVSTQTENHNPSMSKFRFSLLQNVSLVPPPENSFQPGSSGLWPDTTPHRAEFAWNGELSGFDLRDPFVERVVDIRLGRAEVPGSPLTNVGAGQA